MRRGVDMFDCVLPTRSGRTAQAFTRRGTVNLRNARHAEDSRPLDEDCACPACRNHSRAYLHHLFRVGEVLGATLATHHNLSWFASFMGRMRSAIVEGSFEAFRADVHTHYPERPAQKVPRSQKGRRRKRQKR